MEGLSEREYSAHSGLSRGAVQKARKNGRLVLFGDGSINAAAALEHAELPEEEIRVVAGAVEMPISGGPFLAAMGGWG